MLIFLNLMKHFAVVGLANMKLLGLKNSKCKCEWRCGFSGTSPGMLRSSDIVITLLNVLDQNNAKIGAAAICNGGGGASGNGN